MLKRIAISIVRLYQYGVSPLTPAACRYTPTCSEYARRAIERFGVARGGWLATRRLLRCHPFGGRGWDPVPSSGTPAGGETVGATGATGGAGRGGSAAGDPAPVPGAPPSAPPGGSGRGAEGPGGG